MVAPGDARYPRRGEPPVGSCAGAAGFTAAGAPGLTAAGAPGLTAAGAPGLAAGATPGGAVCGGAGDCASEVSVSASEHRHAISSVFIVEAGIRCWFDCGTTFSLSQTAYLRVEQNFSPFLTDTSLLEGRIFNSHHPLSQDVRQVFRIGEHQSIFRFKTNLPCVRDPVLKWRPIADLCFQSIARSEWPRRRKVFQLE